MSTNLIGLKVGSGWGALSQAAYTSSDKGPGKLGQDRAYTAFSGAVLAALSGNPVTGAGPADGSTTTDPNRVGSVAQALQSALASSDGSSASVDALVTKVDKALDQASKALSQAGFSEDAIESFRTKFTQQLSDQLGVLATAAAAAAPPPPPVTVLPGLTQPPATGSTAASGAGSSAAPPATTGTGSTSEPSGAPATTGSDTTGTTAGTPASTGSGTTSSATAATFREVDKANFQLLTTEGDLVTISLRAKSGFDAVGASATGSAGLAAYASVSSYSSSQFRVSVQGNLNTDELKAINDVLGQVSQVASQFFSGNVSQAFSSAASLGFDPKEIAGFALDLSQRTSLSIASVSDGSPTPAVPSGTTTPTLPTTLPAADTTTPATVATDTTTPAVATSAPPTPSTPSTDTTSDTTAAPAAGPAPGDAAQSLLDFLQKALDALGGDTSSGSVQISAKAKLTLLQSTVVATTSSSPEQTAADFLKSVLAALLDTSTTKNKGSVATPVTAAA